MQGFSKYLSLASLEAKNKTTQKIQQQKDEK